MLTSSIVMVAIGYKKNRNKIEVVYYYHSYSKIVAAVIQTYLVF